MDRRVKFGVFDHLDDAGTDAAVQYAERLQLVEACDAAGLHAYHLAEHHGTPHGLAASPGLFLAAAAQRTSRLRLGPMVMLLNLYHPLRAFEEICMLDQLSGGRIELGIGRGGVPMELEFFGVPAEQAQERYREASEIVLKAMAGGTLTHHGQYFALEAVPLTLSPLQRPHPPLWIGTGNPATAAWAAEQKINIACIGPAASIRRLTDAYRVQWRKMAHTGTMPFLGMVRFVVIADSDREARALAAPAYERWLTTLLHLWRRSGASAPYGLPGTLKEAIAAGHCAVGSPATVRDTLREQIDDAGVNYVMCHLAFGDLPLAASLATVAVLRADIISAL